MQARERPGSARRGRSRRRWWCIAAGLVYLSALGGLTWLAFAAASPIRKAVTSKEFQAALRDARNPITEADLPRLLPGIPIYPGAKIDPLFRSQTTKSAREGNPRIHLAAPASPSEIRAFYRSRMTGWEMDRDLGDRDTLAFRRGEERCRISVMPALPLGLGQGEQRKFSIRYYKDQEGER